MDETMRVTPGAREFASKADSGNDIVRARNAGMPHLIFLRASGRQLIEGGDDDDNSSWWRGVVQTLLLARGCSLSHADIPDRLCLALGSFCASLRSARHLPS